MVCERCGKREATSHYQQTINGKTTVYHVCQECASEMGMNQFFQGFNFNIGDMFGGLLSNLTPSSTPAREHKICPECHSDLQTIIKSGKMGCAKCYSTFRNDLLPTIEQLHGKVNHQGKLPKSAGEEARKRAAVSNLKKKLEEAIRIQDFENAARLRDEIKTLEGRDENDKMV